MNDPIDPNLKESIKAGALGGGAMVARVLASTEEMPIKETFKKALCAVITAWIANYYFMEKLDNNNIRAVACGLVGMASPEVISGCVKIIKNKINAYVKIETKPKKKRK